MERSPFQPAFALIASCGLRLTCALVIALFALNPIIGLVLPGAGFASAALATLILGSMAAAGYLLVAVILWTTAEMDRINEVIERVAGAFKLDRMEDRDQAVALVKKAVAHLRAVGVEQACKDFKDPRGEFMHGQFYVFANDVNGLQLCNPRSPQTDGKVTIDKKDAKGHEFVRAYIDVAKTKGKGWHEYCHTNPVTEQVEKKSAYVELVVGVVVGCGIYKAASQPVAVLPARAPGPGRNVQRGLRMAG